RKLGIGCWDPPARRSTYSPWRACSRIRGVPSARRPGGIERGGRAAMPRGRGGGAGGGGGGGGGGAGGGGRAPGGRVGGRGGGRGGRDRREQTCPRCNGDKTVEVTHDGDKDKKTEIITCPMCRGKGKV